MEKSLKLYLHWSSAILRHNLVVDNLYRVFCSVSVLVERSSWPASPIRPDGYVGALRLQQMWTQLSVEFGSKSSETWPCEQNWPHFIHSFSTTSIMQTASTTKPHALKAEARMRDAKNLSGCSHPRQSRQNPCSNAA